MRRDREQRLGQLTNVLDEKILNILTGEYHGGLLFADALHKVSDVLDRREIRQKQIKLINTRDRISSAQKLLGHIREDVEEESVADIFACLEQSFYAKSYKAAVGDVRVSVKEFALRALAYRVQSERNVLQVFGGVKAFLFQVESLIFSFHQFIKIGNNRVVRRFQLAPIRIIGYPEFLIQLYEQQLDGVNFAVGKILIAPEKIPQKTDVLRQFGFGLERSRSVIIGGFISSRFRFEYIYNVFTRHQIDKTAAEIFRQVYIFHFGIKAYYILSALAQIC